MKEDPVLLTARKLAASLWTGPDCGAGHLPLARIGAGEAAHQRVVGNPVAGLGDLVLDFDTRGRLLGVEFLDRAVTPPGLDPA